MTEADLTVAQTGSRVTFHYTLMLADHDLLVDETAEDEPMTIVLGEGELVRGLERCLEGMTAGQKQRFEVACEDAYGLPSEDEVHTMPRSDFPETMALEPGLVVGFKTPTGDEIAGVIRSIEGDDIKVDFSHPLAGHDLVFEVEVVAVENNPGKGEDS